MRNVWVYAASRLRAHELGESLAVLGLGPRYAGAGEPVVPASTDGAGSGRPALAVVVCEPGEPPDGDLVPRLRSAPELDHVPILLVVPAGLLASCTGVAAADEVLVRPFTPAELEARVARATRQAVAPHGGAVVRAGLLELNPATYEVAVDGEPVSFAYMEYELLKFLMTHPNRVFSREALLRSVWGYDYYGGARTVDVHIRRVRAKLGREQARVRTVRSVGYLFELPSTRTAARRPATVHRLETFA